MLDVGIALNGIERSNSRLVTEVGTAAEIRLDEELRVVIVPELRAGGLVMILAAVYEFDGHDHVLLAEPKLLTESGQISEIRITSNAGTSFAFSITPSVE